MCRLRARRPRRRESTVKKRSKIPERYFSSHSLLGSGFIKGLLWCTAHAASRRPRRPRAQSACARAAPGAREEDRCLGPIWCESLLPATKRNTRASCSLSGLQRPRKGTAAWRRGMPDRLRRARPCGRLSAAILFPRAFGGKSPRTPSKDPRAIRSQRKDRPMKLYYAPGACSMAPHVVLREAGYKFDLEKVDIPNKKTAAGEDYWKINPKGYVPALKLDDGQVLTEVQVICQYLADHKADSGLAPKAGTMERYRLMEMLNFTASEIHKQIGALFNPKMTPEMKEVQLAYVERRLNALEKLLEGKQYASGGKFSIADAYLFTILNWTGMHKIDLAKWPNIKAFQARIAARPKVQETMRAEGLVK